MKNKSDNNYTEYRTMPLVVILLCGLILLSIGVYFIISNTSAHGITQPDKYGRGGGTVFSVSGPALVIIGIGIMIFPVLQFIKKAIRKKE
jgi:hypothetical protein